MPRITRDSTDLSYRRNDPDEYRRQAIITQAPVYREWLNSPQPEIRRRGLEMLAYLPDEVTAADRARFVELLRDTAGSGADPGGLRPGDDRFGQRNQRARQVSRRPIRTRNSRRLTGKRGTMRRWRWRRSPASTASWLPTSIASRRPGRRDGRDRDLSEIAGPSAANRSPMTSNAMPGWKPSEERGGSTGTASWPSAKPSSRNGPRASASC